MSKSHQTLIYRPIIVFGVAILAYIISAQVAFANQTPELCDQPDAKYGCTGVIYHSSGGGWRVDGRQWKGAIDGGAQYWQMYWIKDWEWQGSWQFREKWGESGWLNNVSMSSWYEWVNDERDRISDTAVQFKFRYHEYTPDTGWYYWCSRIYTHYLNSGSSQFEGTAACTQS